MTQSLQLVAPETVLVVVATALYLAAAFVPTRRHVWPGIALAALVVALASLAAVAGTAPSDPLQVSVVGGSLALAARGFFLVMGVAFVALSWRQMEGPRAPEYFASLLLVIAGMTLTACAGDLILLFVGLELISLPIYVLLYLPRHTEQSQEAATKYFFLSILSSAVLLYGMALLYGLAGTTNLEGIRQVLAASYVAPADLTPSRLGLLALVLLFAGLGFKIALFPFHFYAPDVYQGSPSVLAGLLAFAPKAAGFLALLRLTSYTMAGFEEYGERVALILAASTMIVGNLLALLQDNLRRLLAYSSIAHAGYMLIGLAVGFAETRRGIQLEGSLAFLTGIQSVLFYLAVYSLMTTGAFGVLVYLSRPRREIETVDDLAGLSRSQPLISAAMAVFLFSLAGVPPLAGFWGKLAVFGAALSVRDPAGGADRWFVALAVIGVINAAVAAVYYLRLVVAMYLREPLASAKPSGHKAVMSAIVACALAVLAIGAWPRMLIAVSQRIGPPPDRQVSRLRLSNAADNDARESVAHTDSGKVPEDKSEK